ncbi:hypothetical protein BKA93DRAFT_722748 [Sparassis latifolia]
MSAFTLSPLKYGKAISEAYPPKPKWSTEDIGNLTGKVIIITGANTGIGFECAQTLASHGAKVYVCARSEQKGLDAVKRITEKIGGDSGLKSGQADFLLLDLADLQSVKKATDEFLKKESRLDVLMNSGGVMMPPAGSVNGAGLELQFATNVLGHFALTRLLLPTLLHTAKTSENGTVRVVNVASSAIMMAPWGGVKLNNIEGSSQMQNYGQSKLGNIIFSNELARRYGDSGILSVSLNPGNIQTELWQHQKSFFTPNTFIHKYPVAMGALTQLYGATSPELTKADSGVYLFPWARKGEALRKEAYDVTLGSQVWDWCEEQMKAAGL